MRWRGTTKAGTGVSVRRLPVAVLARFGRKGCFAILERGQVREVVQLAAKTLMAFEDRGIPNQSGCARHRGGFLCSNLAPMTLGTRLVSNKILKRGRSFCGPPIRFANPVFGGHGQAFGGPEGNGQAVVRGRLDEREPHHE